MTIPITYVRSSLYQGWDLCAQQQFLVYFLGWKNSTGKAACKGTVFHKVMEGLAHIKLGQQNSEEFVIDEVFGKLSTTNFDVDDMADSAFKYYQNTPKKPLEEKDNREIKRWLEKALEYNKGK